MTRIALFALSFTLIACNEDVDDTETDDPGTEDVDTSDSDTEDIDTSDGDTEDIDTEAAAFADVIFTAFLAKNEAGDVDENGDNDDWLEITNLGDADADLTGWGMSDGYPEETPWVFPDDTLLMAGSTLRVWCDEDLEDGPLHADFKLSGDGETVTLLNAAEQVVDEIAYPELADDEVYQRDEAGEWSIVTE